MSISFFAVRENGTLTWLISDHLGSTSLTVDAGGNLISSVKYTAFGEIRSASGVNGIDYRYTGQRKETAIGLYDYHARFYDTALGRFCVALRDRRSKETADTIVPGPGSPQSWDRYAYVKNNPIRYSDPSGHVIAKGCTDPISCGGSAAAIVHNVLISSLPAVLPPNYSYQKDVEGSYCASCWEDPVTGSNDPTGRSQLIELGNNFLTMGLFYKYTHDPKVINTYLTYYEYTKGSIDGQKKIVSLSVINQSYMDVVVDNVYFDVQLNSQSCVESSCMYPQYNDYYLTPEIISPINGGLGIVSGQNTLAIPLIPSGNQKNTNNMFPSFLDISIVVSLSNFNIDPSAGASWPMIIYPIR